MYKQLYGVRRIFFLLYNGSSNNEHATSMPESVYDTMQIMLNKTRAVESQGGPQGHRAKAGPWEKVYL